VDCPVERDNAVLMSTYPPLSAYADLSPSKGERGAAAKKGPLPLLASNVNTATARREETESSCLRRALLTVEAAPGTLRPRSQITRPAGVFRP
jgi:hypothetical protein